MWQPCIVVCCVFCKSHGNTLQAVLLVGFSEQEIGTFRHMMDEMDATFVPVIPCSVAMLDGTLEAAVTSPPPPHNQVRVLDDDVVHSVTKKILVMRYPLMSSCLAACQSDCVPTVLQLPEGTRRAVIMSGMSTPEVFEVIGAYSDTGAIFGVSPVSGSHPSAHVSSTSASYMVSMTCQTHAQNRCQRHCTAPPSPTTTAVICGSCWQKCTRTKNTRRHRTIWRVHTWLASQLRHEALWCTQMPLQHHVRVRSKYLHAAATFWGPIIHVQY